MVNIYRFRYLTFLGLAVRLKIHRPKEIRRQGDPVLLVDKQFSYANFPGPSEALKAAISLRAEYEKKYNLKPRRWLPITGVYCRVRELPDRQLPHCEWRASWRATINGERKNRSFSRCFRLDDPASEREAYSLCVAKRREMEG